MRGSSRRKLEMGRRALEFCVANPDPSPGYAAAVAGLQERLARAGQLAEQQREGLLRVRAAGTRRRELRTMMRRTHLDHIASIAIIAGRETPGLEKEFRRGRTDTFVGFITTAREMAAKAKQHRELLVPHGLADSVLEDLDRSIAEFDAATEQSVQARRTHIGATGALVAVADEVFRIVGGIDGFNRLRFAKDPERLAAWQRASEVLLEPRPSKPGPVTGDGTPPTADVRPAA